MEAVVCKALIIAAGLDVDVEVDTMDNSVKVRLTYDSKEMSLLLKKY